MSAVEMEEAVRNVMEITSRHTEEDKHLFREAIKAHNNNVEAVIGEYFSGDHDSFRQKYVLWNDAHFAADRDGSLDQSFHVQGPDQFPADEPWARGTSANLAAPSRPPSRAHSRSPLDAPTTQEQADEQLRIAMQESMMHTSGVATPQESGVVSTDTSLPQFGPANRPYYEQNQWAVVLANGKSEDPSALVRKRDTDVPIFLACRSQQPAQRHRLGPLLMILHAIPTARNFFLLLEGASQSYGNNKDWWKGANIVATQGWGTEYEDISLVDECQRLMAFLDNSDRAYGTADSLCENSLIKAVWGDPTVKLYESLYNSSPSQELIRMWTRAKVEDSTTEESRPQEFAILEFRIANDTPEMFCNLYSQWDCLFWLQQENSWAEQQDEVLGQIASIQVPAQVMTMRISTDGPAIEVPEVLYIDRYLESNVQTARKMQNKLFRMWKAIDLAREKEIEGTHWTNPKTGQTVDRTKLAKAVIDKSKTQIWRIRANALWRKHENSVGMPDEIPYLPEELSSLAELDEDEQKAISHYEAEIALANLTMAKLDQKLARVRAERDACCALLQQLNKTWTGPSDDLALNPTHKYTLRGVITSPDVVYMCRRDHTKAADEASQGDSWYRVAWMPEDDARIKQEETTIEKVKEAMFTDRNADGNVAPILVYATDEALSDAVLPLSSALQTFVKFDNRLFRQEQIEDNSQGDKKRVAIREPSSLPKRHRSGSADSIASNRASIGDLSDGEDRAALLDDRFESFGENGVMGTELCDMRAISEDEIAAHMVPPPTPPLSGDDGSDQDLSELRRSSEKLADMSLRDEGMINGQQQGERAPEMAELKQPFIVRRPASAMDNRVSIIEKPMEVDPSLEIPGVSPEQYYHQPS